eukprot:CAMPEP_0114304264 /NCGR_PEP_ID=MMETSP0059-20121206/15689_1 /TAXON_ID=36894 /ORGANISM="Pyramimonas parkeae, Strain CCMP726" /LENGTH=207 /DNA_ID=CAMNT_0001427341 /DNA_START=273 /DNA_END=892 /DNA_ORIENTATION=+
MKHDTSVYAEDNMSWASRKVLLMGPIGQGRKATVAALRECTYDVSECSSTCEANSLILNLRTRDEFFDMLIMEDSLDTAKESTHAPLRSLIKAVDCPTFVSSTRVDAHVVRQWLSLGAVDVLPAPITRNSVQQMREHCALRRKKNQSPDFSQEGSGGSPLGGSVCGESYAELMGLDRKPGEQDREAAASGRGSNDSSFSALTSDTAA